MTDVSIASSRRIHSGWNRLDVLQLQYSADGEQRHITREVLDHGHAAAVLVYDTTRRTTVLVRQLRAGKFFAEGQGVLIEVPAGLIDAGETPEDAARREVGEEVGLKAGHLDFVVAAYSSASSLTERIWLYLCEVTIDPDAGIASGALDHDEDLEIVEMRLRDLGDHADAGEITDMKTLILVEALRRRRPELF
ncbi:NUDIX domain-containing protein [Hartmannibacter diazotrophicus]|uniref:NUDIX domain-containing protein n=1 Tax=Hartmannibacter diazotrophicus TaxID=1482074 RepID=UPI0012FE19ED|nr:NUDIX hydrolase [Hartmannibacter diazotrophicus]